MKTGSPTVEFTTRASLAALGLRFRQLRVWDVIEAHVQVKQMVREHTPTEKLLDCFIGILVEARGMVEVNTRVRPDRAAQWTSVVR